MQHITECSAYFQAQWWLHHVMGLLVIVKDWGVFQDKKNKQNGAKNRQNPRESWFSLLSTRHWETNSPFSRTIT